MGDFPFSTGGDRLSMSGKKGNDLVIQASLRVMIVEFSQRVRKETGLIESSRRLLIQSIQRLRTKAEILAAATKFAQASRKVAAYNTVQEALTRIREGASQLAQSKSPPPDLGDALRTVCVVGDLLSIDSFAKFKSSSLRDLFGQAAVVELSDQTKVPEALKLGLLDETFSEQQILDVIRQVIQQFMRGDMTNYEKIFGETPSAQPPSRPQPPSGGLSLQSQTPSFPKVLAEQPPSKPPSLEKAPAPSHQEMPALFGQSQVLRRPQQAPSRPPAPSKGPLAPLGQSMSAPPPQLQAPQRDQQAPLYPQVPSVESVPPSLGHSEAAPLPQSQTPQRDQQAPLYPQVPSIEQASSRSSRHADQAQQPPAADQAPSGHPTFQYTKMGFVFPLIDVPVFPREIWGQMANEIRAAIS
jgi:hypothetical protein